MYSAELPKGLDLYLTKYIYFKVHRNLSVLMVTIKLSKRVKLHISQMSYRDSLLSNF